MKNRYLDGLALGLALGFILSSLIYWSLDATSDVVKNFLSEQITHVVTLLAAALALFGISQQIQSNFVLAERTRIAKLDAAKATLPIVLSNISQMCEERYYSIAFGDAEPQDNMRWQMTDVELSTLKECIEHGDGFEKELMQQILKVYQVLISRWPSIKHERIFGAQAIAQGDPARLDRLTQFSAISNWATLQAIATSLFNYSRGAVSNPSFEQMTDGILRTLRHIHTGGRTGEAGSALTNNSDYRAFLEMREDSRSFSFIGDSWND